MTDFPIVRYDAQNTLPRNEVVRFGAIVRALQKESTLPIVEMALDGFWLVLVKLFQKHYGREMGTDTEVEKISQVAEQLVDIGLNLSFSSSEEAETVFFHAIIGGIVRAINLGVRPGMEISTSAWDKFLIGEEDELRALVARQQASDSAVPAGSFWGVPVATFLAAMIRKTNELKTSLIAQYKRIRQLNRLDYRAKFVWSSGAADDASSVESFLDGHVVSMKEIISFSGKLAQAEASIRALQEMVVPWDALMKNLREFQIPIIENTPSIRGLWLNTQILLAVLDVPVGRQYVEHGEYESAVLGLYKVAEEVLATRVLERTTTKKASEFLHQMVVEQIRRLRQVLESRPAVDDVVIERILTRVDPDRVAISHKSALLHLQGLNNNDKLTKASFNGLPLETVFAAVQWGKVSEKSAVDVFNGGKLPPELMVKAILSMRRPVAIKLSEHAVENFLPQYLSPLIAANLVAITLDNFASLAPVIPVSNAERILLRLNNQHVVGTTFFVKGLIEISPEVARTVFSSVALRSVVVAEFMDRLVESEFVKHKSTQEQVGNFIAKVGRELWTEALLGFVLHQRQKMLKEALEGNKEHDVFLVDWSDLADEDPFYLQHRLTMDKSEVEQTLREYSEESICRFVYAGSSDPEKEVKKYFALRDKYRRSLLRTKSRPKKRNGAKSTKNFTG